MESNYFLHCVFYLLADRIYHSFMDTQCTFWNKKSFHLEEEKNFYCGALNGFNAAVYNGAFCQEGAH